MNGHRHTFPTHFSAVIQNQLENAESCKYFGSMLTNDGRCTGEIKSRIGMAKDAFNKKWAFSWHVGHKIEEEANEVLHLEHSFIQTWWQLASPCCWNRARPWYASELVSFLVGLRTYQHPGMVLKLWRFGQQNRNNWKVLKCGAGEGWRRSVGPIVWEMEKCYLESRSRGISYMK